MTQALILDAGNQPATQFQPNKLPGTEHLPVMAVTPAVKPVGFIARQNLLVGNEAGAGPAPPLLGLGNAR